MKAFVFGPALALVISTSAYAASSGTLTSSGPVTSDHLSRQVQINISDNVNLVWKSSTGPSVVIATKHYKSPNAWAMDSDWEGVYTRSDIGRNAQITLGQIPASTAQSDDFSNNSDWSPQAQ